MNPTRTCASPDRVVVFHVLDEIYGVKKQSIISAKRKLRCVLFLSFQHICLVIFFGKFPTETLLVGCLKVLKVNEHPETQESFFVAIAGWFGVLVLVLLQATPQRSIGDNLYRVL